MVWDFDGVVESIIFIIVFDELDDYDFSVGVNDESFGRKLKCFNDRLRGYQNWLDKNVDIVK